MSSEVVIIGAKDRELERLLAAIGLRTSQLPVAELATLAHAAARQPDVVVVDVRGGQALPPAVTMLKRQHPATPVLLVTSSLEPAIVLEAMRAGVNECVAEPLQASEIETAVTRLLAHKQPVAAGQVFAFIGAKGGVGTTTVAVNVATELSRSAPDRTLIVDLHLAHGDAAVFLGVEPRFSVVDALDNNHRFDDAFFKGLVVSLPAVRTARASDKQLAQTSSVSAYAAWSTSRPACIDTSCSTCPVGRGCPRRAGSGARSSWWPNQEGRRCATPAGSPRRCASAMDERSRDRQPRRHARRIGREDVEKVVGTRVVPSVPSDYRMALRSLTRVAWPSTTTQQARSHFPRDRARPRRRARRFAPESTGLFGLLKGRR